MIIRYLVCIALFFLKCSSTGLIKHVNYCKIPKISPGACIFQRPFLRGLFLDGLIYEGKFAFQNQLGRPYSWKFTVFPLFYFVFDGNFQVQAPQGLIFRGAISRKVFCVTSLGGLYMEGLIFGILRYFFAQNMCITINKQLRRALVCLLFVLLPLLATEQTQWHGRDAHFFLTYHIHCLILLLQHENCPIWPVQLPGACNQTGQIGQTPIQMVGFAVSMQGAIPTHSHKQLQQDSRGGQY